MSGSVLDDTMLITAGHWLIAAVTDLTLLQLPTLSTLVQHRRHSHERSKLTRSNNNNIIINTNIVKMIFQIIDTPPISEYQDHKN